MAGERTASWPFAFLQGALASIAALPGRNIRITVLLCVVAIGGSFAAAGALQMRFDRVQAFRQAAYFETNRARAVAAVAEASLGRYERFARPQRRRPDDRPCTGARLARHRGGGFARDRFCAPKARPSTCRASASWRGAGASSWAPGSCMLIAFRDGADTVAVSFDTSALAPRTLLDGVELTGPDGARLGGALGGAPSAGGARRQMAASGARRARRRDALAAWYGSLPLYLFVILGPALVGGGLAAVFVREFERRAKAADAIRALRSTHPAEARLLVRLANAEREAVEAQRSKTEFVAHMSHELRTPLERHHRLRRSDRARLLWRGRPSQIHRICPRHRHGGAQPAFQDRRHPRIRQPRSRALSAEARPLRRHRAGRRAASTRASDAPSRGASRST